MLSEEQRAENGEYPVFVFNPNPYEFNDNVECEFVLQNQNWSETEESEISVYDTNGFKLSSQVVKEESNVNLDWRKRIIFNATLAPLTLNRFSVKVNFSPKKAKQNNDLFLYEDEFKRIEIDPTTGLLKSFSVGGKEYLNNGFCQLFLMIMPTLGQWEKINLTALEQTRNHFCIPASPVVYLKI